MPEDPPVASAASAMRALLEQQADEIASLRQRLAAEDLAGDLRDTLGLVTVATALSAPIGEERFLELILSTAMQAIAANAAALFLVDEERNDLVFRLALGGEAGGVQGLRVPLGHGVAGLVAVSGQPMILSDADGDVRQASDIAARVNYQPRTILCVPMLLDDRVIGVLELLDKLDAPVFTMGDMATLSSFAEQAAVAIEQAQVQQHLARLVRSLIGGEAGASVNLQRRTADFIADLDATDPAFRRGVELAALVREIVRYGDDEARTCMTLLEGFAAYLRGRGARERGNWREG